jgi:hypothetical protein
METQTTYGVSCRARAGRATPASAGDSPLKETARFPRFPASCREFGGPQPSTKQCWRPAYPGVSWLGGRIRSLARPRLGFVGRQRESGPRGWLPRSGGRRDGGRPRRRGAGAAVPGGRQAPGRRARAQPRRAGARANRRAARARGDDPPPARHRARLAGPGQPAAPAGGGLGAPGREAALAQAGPPRFRSPGTASAGRRQGRAGALAQRPAGPRRRARRRSTPTRPGCWPSRWRYPGTRGTRSTPTSARRSG